MKLSSTLVGRQIVRFGGWCIRKPAPAASVCGSISGLLVGVVALIFSFSPDYSMFEPREYYATYSAPMRAAVAQYEKLFDPVSPSSGFVNNRAAVLAALRQVESVYRDSSRLRWALNQEPLNKLAWLEEWAQLPPHPADQLFPGKKALEEFKIVRVAGADIIKVVLPVLLGAAFGCAVFLILLAGFSLVGEAVWKKRQRRAVANRTIP